MATELCREGAKTRDGLPSPTPSRTPMYRDFIIDDDHVLLDVDSLPLQNVNDLDLNWARQMVKVRGYFDKDHRLSCGGRNLIDEGSNLNFAVPLWLKFVKLKMFGPLFGDWILDFAPLYFIIDLALYYFL